MLSEQLLGAPQPATARLHDAAVTEIGNLLMLCNTAWAHQPPCSQHTKTGNIFKVVGGTCGNVLILFMPGCLLVQVRPGHCMHVLPAGAAK